MTDLTPFYWDDQTTAAALNVSVAWLRKNRKTVLEADGFPKRDPVVRNQYVAADVRAWIENRRQVRERVVDHMPELGEI